MAAKKPPVGRTMRAAYLAAEDFRGAEIVKPGELIEVRYADGRSPSLASRKVLNLLIGKAAGDAWKPGRHQITKRELRGSHESNDRIADILDELMSIRFKVEIVSRRGRPAIVTAAVLAWNLEETEDDDSSVIEWEFTEVARKIFQRSDHYGCLSRAALLSFDSKYSLTLYEMGCKRCGLRNPSWRGTVAELREILGISPELYSDWANLRRKTLDQAKAELDQLAHFTLAWKEKRQGRKVVEVELWFWPKDDAGLDAAAREVDRPRAGRKARRKDQADPTSPDMAPDTAIEPPPAPRPQRKATGRGRKRAPQDTAAPPLVEATGADDANAAIDAKLRELRQQGYPRHLDIAQHVVQRTAAPDWTGERRHAEKVALAKDLPRLAAALVRLEEG